MGKKVKDPAVVAKRQARRKMIAARAHWARLAAYKLTAEGYPTTVNCGYSVLAAKIQMAHPEIRGSRQDIFATFVGEKNDADALNKAYLQARNRARSAKLEKAKAECAAAGFYESREWRELRYRALVLHGGACQCCGATAKDGVKLHVDHIKPRSKFPALELEIANLQILCEVCNLGKSNKDATDWRPAECAA